MAARAQEYLSRMPGPNLQKVAYFQNMTHRDHKRWVVMSYIRFYWFSKNIEKLIVFNDFYIHTVSISQPVVHRPNHNYQLSGGCKYPKANAHLQKILDFFHRAQTQKTFIFHTTFNENATELDTYSWAGAFFCNFFVIVFQNVHMHN